MPWFKVDDGFCFHPKALAAGNSALGLWVRAGSWCGANLTGGALPRHMIGTLGAQKRDAMRLVFAGLWCETEDGYQFNDWDVYQPTKEQVEADRKSSRERQARYREAKRNAVSNAVTSPVSHAVSNAAPTRPDPTHSSSGTTSGGAKRATQLPADWKPNDSHLEIAKEYGLDPAFELRAFRDHHEAKGTTYKSWDAAFRTWLNKSRSFKTPAYSTPSPVSRRHVPLEVPAHIDPDDTEAYAAWLRAEAK
jgi:hypothetical protein